MLIAAQIRAARALLGWGQEKLAREAGVSRPTIKRMEGPVGPGRSAAATLDAVRTTLEIAGVEFVAEDEGAGAGAGVRLRKAAATLLARTADPIHRVIHFRIAYERREYDCSLRSSVLDGLDGKVPGYTTPDDMELSFDRNQAIILDRARKVIVGGLAAGGRVSLWPEDFPELR